MRGGTSKGVYFLARDLPPADEDRDSFLLRMMGTPDHRQIDGIGGAHPLTSKVAIVSPSDGPDTDVDYLFLQLGVEDALVSDRQNCGNLLAGVGPFAIERGLVDADGTTASVRVRMVNTESIATATFELSEGSPVYSGRTAISGVPGTAAPIRLDFEGIAGGSCGALMPTGNVIDTIDGIEVTCIDNGMPVIVMAAESFGVSGNESCSDLETNADLRARIEKIRISAGHLMNLGDVSATTVPKITLVSPATSGGSISTRTFIPHRCHDAIGVLGAVSVATAALLPGSTAAPFCEQVSDGKGSEGKGSEGKVSIEHPTGTLEAAVEIDASSTPPQVIRAGIIRTARKLFDGKVFARDD